MSQVMRDGNKLAMRLDIDNQVWILFHGDIVQKTVKYADKKVIVQVSSEFGKFYKTENGGEKLFLKPMDHFKVNFVDFFVVAICSWKELMEHGLDVASEPPLHMEMAYRVEGRTFFVKSTEVSSIYIGEDEFPAELKFENGKFWYSTYSLEAGKRAVACEPGRTFEDNGVKTKIIAIGLLQELRTD